MAFRLLGFKDVSATQLWWICVCALAFSKVIVAQEPPPRTRRSTSEQLSASKENPTEPTGENDEGSSSGDISGTLAPAAPLAIPAHLKPCGPNEIRRWGICEQGCNGFICAPGTSPDGHCDCLEGLVRRERDYKCVTADKCYARCIDTHYRCQTMAASGECNTNPEYMKVHCPVSCNSCDVVRR